jgi:hybrid polyketide synthase/nonribosomal peptide synthetase ACE1
LHNVEQNARLNSSRRVITKTVPISRSNFSISQRAASPPSLVEDVLPMANKDDQGLVRVETSSLMALRVASDAFLFLAIGKTMQQGAPLLLYLQQTLAWGTYRNHASRN